MSFNQLLEQAGLNPREVRLLRHAARSERAEMHPHTAWQRDRERFELYQSTQNPAYASFFAAPYWASFVSVQGGGTLFVGIYEAQLTDPGTAEFVCPLTHRAHPAGRSDRYSVELTPHLAAHRGELFVDWGPGTRAWRQHADRRDKPIVM